MPGWHVTTQKWRESGRLRMFGIALEQHPDRTRLFMEAGEMRWPVSADPFNLFELPLVPVTLALDEHGVVRMIHPPPDDPGGFEREFLDREFDPPADTGEAAAVAPPDLAALRTAALSDGVDAWRHLAVALTLWGEVDDLDEAVAAAQRAVELDDTGQNRFTLGVVLRRRFDSPARRDGDLVRAVEQWTASLDAEPNNYIRRRRLQQYGPRLAKPYPFYDWVGTARAAIVARGEDPPPLPVEPGGAELLGPSDTFEISDAPTRPDPDGRIAVDEGLVRVHHVVVPPAVTAGDAARVHLVFEPVAGVHWNNETHGLELWTDPPEGWAVDRRSVTLDNPPAETSDEARVVEVEVRAPADAPPGAQVVRAYALYYVCEEVDGVCVYRRQDIEVTLEVVEETRRGLADRSLRT